MQLTVTAGQTIYLQAGSVYEYEHGPLQLHVTEIVRPANDDRANATEITSVAYSDDVNVLGATAEPGEQACGGTKTVWYRYQPTQNVVVSASGAGPNESAYVQTLVESSPGILDASACYSSTPRRVNAGQVVYIRAAASGNNDGKITIHVSAVTPIANDDFADAADIGSLPFSADVDTTLSTREPGEVRYGCGSEDGSVWYKYTSSVDALVVLRTRSFGGVSDAMGVFSGTTLATLAPVACSAFNLTDYLQFTVQAGIPVYIRIGSSSGAGQHLTFDVIEARRAANDDFSNAQSVDSLPFMTTLTNISATLEPSEPANCGSPKIPSSVWYRFIVPDDRKLLMRVKSYFTDATLAAYTGTSLADLTLLGCQGLFQSGFEVNPPVGTSVYVQVGGIGSGVPVELSIIPLIPPENDAMTGATRIDSLPYESSASSIAATVEPGEPTVCGPFRSVWYAYTPNAGTTIVRIDAGDASVAAFVTSGASPTDADLAGCASVQQVPVEAGKTLFIRAGGYLDDVALKLREVHPPANDRLVDAVDIHDLPFSDQVNTADAYVDPQEPSSCRGTATTVWYKYTARESVTLAVDTFGSDFDTIISAFRADPSFGFVPIDCFDAFLPTDHERLSIAVAPGETIYIQAGGYDRTSRRRSR